MNIILTNAFSANMINIGWYTDIRFTSITADTAAIEIVKAGGCVNAIGHIDTDNIVRNMLIMAYPAVEKYLNAGERETVSIDEATMLIVAQYKGQRLPEGATALPDEATIEFLAVTILPRGSVNLLKAAELAYKEEIETTDSGETDVGGYPIAGDYRLKESGRTIGGWGPTCRENRITIGEVTYFSD